jgi:hypothetical protein
LRNRTCVTLTSNPVVGDAALFNDDEKFVSLEAYSKFSLKKYSPQADPAGLEPQGYPVAPVTFVIAPSLPPSVIALTRRNEPM